MVDLAENSEFSCSFCGKPQKEVNKLVSGPSVYICEECVTLCNDIIEEAEEKNKLANKSQARSLKKPSEIKKILDSYVIGQDQAKKVLSVAVYNHYKRIDDNVDTSDVELQKSNVLLLGPTGTGKTLLAQTLAKILDVPFCVADATSLTEAGYVGEDVESIVGNLLTAADGDVELAMRGIVYVDEIDKITRKGESTSITRDVSGEGVQQALLKMIEGTKCNVPPRGGRKHPNQDFLQIDTSQILFICGGAFSGLEKLIEQRVYKKSIGFGSEIKKGDKDQKNILQFVEPQDLTKFGLIPEFIGRLPVISALESLDKGSLIKILTEPQNALIKQYQCLLELDGIKLSFTEKALEVIAEQALKNKTGARGLRTLLESAMLDIMFDMPSTKGVFEIVLNERSVLKKEKPLIVMATDLNSKKSAQNNKASKKETPELKAA